MNAAQIHLALNHAPLFFSLIGGGILIFGLIKKNEPFKNLSLYLLVAAALFTAPVFLTGEGTEELIEHLPGVTEGAIGKHEDLAKISLVVIIITGVVALAGLFLKKNAKMAKIVFAAALLLSLASFGTMVQTAHLGGLIRHNEIQTGTVAGENSGENEEEKEEEEKGPALNTTQPTTITSDSIRQQTGKDEQVKKDDDD